MMDGLDARDGIEVHIVQGLRQGQYRGNRDLAGQTQNPFGGRSRLHHWVEDVRKGLTVLSPRPGCGETLIGDQVCPVQKLAEFLPEFG